LLKKNIEIIQNKQYNRTAFLSARKQHIVASYMCLISTDEHCFEQAE